MSGFTQLGLSGFTQLDLSCFRQLDLSGFTQLRTTFRPEIGESTPEDSWSDHLKKKTLHNYFTEMCSGSEAGSHSRRIDCVYHSTLGLRVNTKKRGENVTAEDGLAAPCPDQRPTTPLLIIHICGLSLPLLKDPPFGVVHFIAQWRRPDRRPPACRRRAPSRLRCAPPVSGLGVEV